MRGSGLHGIDLAVAPEQAEDDGPPRVPRPRLPRAARAEPRLINLDFAVLGWRLAFAFFGDAVADFAKERDD